MTATEAYILDYLPLAQAFATTAAIAAVVWKCLTTLPSGVHLREALFQRLFAPLRATIILAMLSNWAIVWASQLLIGRGLHRNSTLRSIFSTVRANISIVTTSIAPLIASFGAVMLLFSIWGYFATKDNFIRRDHFRKAVTVSAVIMFGGGATWLVQWAQWFGR